MKKKLSLEEINSGKSMEAKKKPEYKFVNLRLETWRKLDNAYDLHLRRNGKTTMFDFMDIVADLVKEKYETDNT